ncbi:MAG: DNA polymerase III subunit delta [Actinomycetaceae bacterium]|nr:DNA polymerase III subunit delta [Actinomycetaceae bacterium]
MAVATRSSSKSSGASWQQATLAPVVFFRGPEDTFARNAFTRLTEQARASCPDVDIHQVDVASYESGGLAQMASPSLFGGFPLILVDRIESAPQAFQDDLLSYLLAPSSEAWLVLRHRGGVAGKRMVDALRKAKVPTFSCERIEKLGDQVSYLQALVSGQGRRAESAALTALAQALGSDLGELTAVTQQLLDTTSAANAPLTEDIVREYVGSRVEFKAWDVADIILSGNHARALKDCRIAVSTGCTPVAIVMAVASKLRQLAKLHGGQANPQQLGMPPWLVRKLSGEARQWSDDGLAHAIIWTAEADHMVKGGSRDPGYALEKMIHEIAAGRTM